MLTVSKVSCRAISPACFSSSLPLLCIFYFVVCLVSFQPPQGVKSSSGLCYLQLFLPLTDFLLKIKSSKTVSLLFFLAHKHVFSSNFFSVYIHFFPFKNIYSHSFIFYKHINCVIHMRPYLSFVCRITW